jgi:hypothetical protein
MAGIKSQFGCNGNARTDPLHRHFGNNRGEFDDDLIGELKPAKCRTGAFAQRRLPAT